MGEPVLLPGPHYCLRWWPGVDDSEAFLTQIMDLERPVSVVAGARAWASASPVLTGAAT